jgi:hypothetical protein
LEIDDGLDQYRIIDDTDNTDDTGDTNKTEHADDTDDDWLDQYRISDDNERPTKDSELQKTLKNSATQAVLGGASSLTWPLDVLKSLVVGAHHPTDEHEILDLERRTGIPINREELKKSQEQFSQIGKNVGEYIPTQDAAEKKFEEYTGSSIRAKTGADKALRQFGSIASMSAGGTIAQVLKKAAGGVAVTTGLESAGVPEPIARLIGDASSSAKLGIKKGFTDFSEDAKALQSVSNKHGLPFLEYMILEKEPMISSAISARTARRLHNEVNLSMNRAIENIAAGGLKENDLRNSLTVLRAASSQAHSDVDKLASKITRQIDTKPVVNTLEKKLKELKAKRSIETEVPAAEEKVLEHAIAELSPPPPAPIPKSDSAIIEAQTAVDIRKQDLDKIIAKYPGSDSPNIFASVMGLAPEESKAMSAMKIASAAGDSTSAAQISKALQEYKKTSKDLQIISKGKKTPQQPKLIPPKTHNATQIINDIRNNNAQVDKIYNKTGRLTSHERRQKRIYEFVNEQLRSQLERVDDGTILSELKKANAVTQQLDKVRFAENSLSKFLGEASYGSKKLFTELNSARGQKLKDIIGTKAFSELESVAKYGRRAEENMQDFLGRAGPHMTADDRVALQTASFLLSGRLARAAGVVAGRLNHRWSSKALMEPAVRKSYRRLVVDAGKANYPVLIKDSVELVRNIEEVFGSVDAFSDRATIDEFATKNQVDK